jgi:hypothetical protein
VRVPPTATTLCPPRHTPPTQRTRASVPAWLPRANQGEARGPVPPTPSGSDSRQTGTPPAPTTFAPSARRGSRTPSARMPPRHRRRNAVLSLRPSRPQQGRHTPARRRRPDALRQRAQDVGGPAAARDRMARDLGTTAASAAPRQGWKDALAPVPRGHVGRCLACAGPRLSRHGAAGSPRLAVGGERDGLLAERDAGSDPRSPPGRVWLGWQGQRSA